MRYFLCRLLSVAFVCSVVGVQAATLRVPAQYTNIQAAIESAATGDVVLVAPGTYAANIISFSGKAITVMSEAGPDVTILDGNRAVAVVAFGSGETRSSVLSGFTIRNGGSGISLSGASATIVSNIFENNDLVMGARILACPSKSLDGNVRRVKGLFALADELEERLKARGQVDALTPSLLARAFSGQLVPQDPTDEPAEKLLQRVQAANKEPKQQPTK